MAPSIKSLLATAALALLPVASAENMLTSDSLATCIPNSNFSATLFDVSLTPANKTLNFNVVGVSNIQGKVILEIAVYAYGLKVYSNSLDPCTSGLQGMCPMNEGPIALPGNFPISEEALSQVPGKS